MFRYPKMGAHFMKSACLFLFALWLTGCTPLTDKSVPSPRKSMKQASAFLQADKLYASAELDSVYLNKIMTLLYHGEPILATYRFRFYRVHTWLPDVRLSHILLKRQLRRRLITGRFEMMDVKTGQLHYTNNQEEAKGFLGAPRYVLLGKEARFSKEQSYRLRVDLTMEHAGMSSLLRVLNQWLTFGRSGIYSFSYDFIHK